MSDDYQQPIASETSFRSRWDNTSNRKSRVTFILAAIGSAIGLGNLWRFPNLAYKYGGGAFFIPYLLALFFIGIPLLTLEFSMGQLHQGGDLIAFGKITKRLRGIGIGSVIAAFFVTTYYVVIIGWSLVYLIYSFYDDMPWAPYSPEELAADSSLSTMDKASAFFNEKILSMGPDGGPLVGEDGLSESVVSWRAVVGTMFAWLCIFLSLFRGPMMTGRIVWFTVTIPVLTLLVLFFRGVTLDGANDGVNAYIGIWDLTTLGDAVMWQEAVTQIFFSIGVCYGVMTAYASYNYSRQAAPVDAIIVALSNSFFSFIAGFVVFSTLGYLAKETGGSIDSITSGGPGLVFVTYPVALATIPYPGGQIFCFFLFLTLFLLGIDSAFSLTDASLTVLNDSKMFGGSASMALKSDEERAAARKSQYTIVALFVCIPGALLSLPYTAHFGITLLDIVDHFVNNVGMLWVGTLECISVGWFYACHERADMLPRPFNFHFFWLALVPILGCIAGGAEGVNWLLLALPLWMWLVWAVIGLRQLDVDAPDGQSEAFWRFGHSIVAIQEDLMDLFGLEGEGWMLAMRAWAVLIKFVLVPILTALLVVSIYTRITVPYGISEGSIHGYDAVYQIIGALAAACVVVPALLGFLFDELYEVFVPASSVDAARLLNTERAWDGTLYDYGPYYDYYPYYPYSDYYYDYEDYSEEGASSSGGKKKKGGKAGKKAAAAPAQEEESESGYYYEEESD